MRISDKLLRLAALCLGLSVFGGCAADAGASPALVRPLAAAPTQSQELTARAEGELRVHCIDVGQADSLFLELPDGKTMLIDAGNRGDDTVIRAYLEAQGCERLDYVVATHPHADHIGGMASLLETYEVGAFYMPRVVHTSDVFEKMIAVIESKGLKIKVAAAGASIPSEGYALDFVAPNNAEYENLNNYSAVLHLRYGSRAFLFTGDMETLSEEEITADIRSDLLKVGHHGSDTSTSPAFLQRVAPSYAVISVGEGNSYGHPVGSVLASLADAGVSVARTDQNGNVVYSSDGESLTVYCDQGTTQTPVLSAAEAAEPPPQTSSAEASDNVWMSATGSKYHAIPTCSSMKNATELTREQAISRGLTPCSRCKP